MSKIFWKKISWIEKLISVIYSYIILDFRKRIMKQSNIFQERSKEIGRENVILPFLIVFQLKDKKKRLLCQIILLFLFFSSSIWLIIIGVTYLD